ncbi:MAG: heme-binding protein [Candidatus Sulfotelmatobacter sp.]
MVGKPIGGVIVFGGGLPLYDSKGKIVGGLGLSGDTSCADHIMAWKVRQLQLDAVPMGPSPDHNDNMILDWSNSNTRTTANCIFVEKSPAASQGDEVSSCH